ncbi:MAG: hypothetical protein NTZ99_04175 [Burkholderiales bacterium]|nr:hypothetical protein [Burkholderiales bacterium]
MAAARMIAEDGTDYATAKRKAAKLILGNNKTPGDVMPDNAQVEAEVREYQALFMGDEQPARLKALRLLALELMQTFERFHPRLVGAVVNGTAGEHTDIHIQLFPESSKDVAVFLLNADIDYVVGETAHTKQRGEFVETYSFMWKNEGVHLTIYEPDDVRSASKTGNGHAQEYLNLRMLKALLTEDDPT